MGKTVRYGAQMSRQAVREFRDRLERVEKSGRSQKREKANRKALKYTYADYASLD